MRGKAIMVTLAMGIAVLAVPGGDSQGSLPQASGDYWGTPFATSYYTSQGWAGVLSWANMSESHPDDDWYAVTNTLRQINSEVWYMETRHHLDFGEADSGSPPSHVDWSPGTTNTGSGTVTFQVGTTGASASMAYDWGNEWKGEWRIVSKSTGDNGDSYEYARMREKFTPGYLQNDNAWDFSSHGNAYHVKQGYHHGFWIQGGVKTQAGPCNLFGCPPQVWEVSPWEWYPMPFNPSNNCETDTCASPGTLPSAPLPPPDFIPPLV